MAQPTIGIILDWQQNGSFSDRPHYALRTSYFHAIHQAGGLPIAIPYIEDTLSDYLEKIDGLLLPGGDYALPADWYVNKDEGSPHPPSERLAFDLALIETALKKRIPLLAVCAGMQELAGVLGGKITGNVQTYYDTEILHRGGLPAEQTAHPVNIKPDSLLARITGQTTIDVNSHHAEAVVESSEKFTVSGTAPDGVIEAIEISDHPFALGLEWHPEFLVTEHDQKIFKAFISACQM